MTLRSGIAEVLAHEGEGDVRHVHHRRREQLTSRLIGGFAFDLVDVFPAR